MNGALPARSEDSVARDYANLVSSYATNESARDSFLAVAHTAIFAASIAFVGGVVRFENARLTILLLLSWFAGIVGLIGLTLSFHLAQRSLKRQIKHVRDPVPIVDDGTDWLNWVALWSFPVSVLALAGFLATNVIAPMAKLPPIDTKAITDPSGVQAGVMAAPRLTEVMENKESKTDLKKGITSAPRQPQEGQDISSGEPAKPSENKDEK